MMQGHIFTTTARAYKSICINKNTM